MEKDPALTNPNLYRVVMENDRVRVLEYHDRPGDRTTDHAHPDGDATRRSLGPAE